MLWTNLWKRRLWTQSEKFSNPLGAMVRDKCGVGAVYVLGIEGWKNGGFDWNGTNGYHILISALEKYGTAI